MEIPTSAPVMQINTEIKSETETSIVVAPAKTPRKFGGAQPNAGRPKGKRDPHTIQKALVEKAMKERIYKKTSRLINAAMVPALGQVFVYKIEEEVTGSGPRGGEYKKRKHTLVTSPYEIERALNFIDGEGGAKDPNGDSYYYVTTKEPDHKAIEMLLNRAFGKPKETLDANINHTFSLRTLAQRRELLKRGEIEIIPIEEQ